MPSRFFSAALIAAFAGMVHAAKPHVHGTGSLDVVIDKGQIGITLELPLDAAVGFERAPKTDKEKAALAAVAGTLNDAPALFIPTSAANCTVRTVTVTVPFLDGKAQGVEHADVEATYVFQCANPAALKGIETTLFKHFKRLYRLETRRAGPAGQGAARLTPKQPTLNW
ncbi:MAG: DUF2796 domain-containing protein [Gammaproteobacteria bacterium]|nr:DUF2796 domain-containing protein [Rhodocyclaceae bacterium]MBU3910712.1 DUF2796 domain-containing protein [Gammaproteobacteria bacterium]MBU3988502.1 DUF2796 domain-containing protein [Gammaproteobacteria bacterium]MBU4003421.1 DUF2796 domain-containing protein [Gammaproteobacteria bacterium]MBU4021892.1 DUF2796 domain-containing protein [Gammaproteobacteria bacterium]